MNAERLLANFDRIFDAPHAISRLRRFILDLAVRGKLVAQDPDDGLAVNFDCAIPTDLIPPFDVPKNWELGAAVCIGSYCRRWDSFKGT